MSQDGNDLAARVGARLRERRTALGSRLADVAAGAGISVSHLSAIEKGASIPSLPVLARVAHAVGLTISSILEDEQRARLRHGSIPTAAVGATSLALPELRLRIAVLVARGSESGSPPIEIDDGDVFVYVRSGMLEIELDGEAYALRKGDSIEARDAGAMRWRTASRAKCVSIWATTRTRSGPLEPSAPQPPVAPSR